MFARLWFKVPSLPFIKYLPVGFGLSLLMMFLSVVFLVIRPLNLGLDYTGGTLIEIGFSKPVMLDPVRKVLSDMGVESSVVQHYGQATDVLIRLAKQPSENFPAELISQLQTIDPNIELRRVESVGPQVGADLLEKGILALLASVGLMLAYVTVRFKSKFALAAVAALVHDLLLVVGFCAITQMSFDLNVLAALFATLGYSLNDTLVIQDRIRENFKQSQNSNVNEVLNLSLNQTFGRTINTATTTLLVLLALLFVAGPDIQGFTVAMLVGVFVGTYSSLFVVTYILQKMNVSAEDFLDSPEIIEANNLP
jgi:preprotein translocase subunit SecF